MTALRDLLATPESEIHRSALASEATGSRDLTGAPVDPREGLVDMAGAPFPELGGARPTTAALAAQSPAGTRGLGGWYVTGLVALVLITGGLSSIIRGHNRPSTAASAATATSQDAAAPAS
jgi:hypothetical protein